MRTAVTNIEAHGPIFDKATLRSIMALLKSGSPLKLETASGEVVDLPEPIVEVLLVATRLFQSGDCVAVFEHGKPLTTEAAAALLCISRPQVVQLIESGQIASEKVGKCRRVMLEAVLRYKFEKHSKRNTIE